MKPIAMILAALVVIGLAWRAYHENYKTQQALRDVSALQVEIADLREELSVLNAEWAYLNRPERLRDLVEINYDRLGLLPLQAHQFGRIDQISLAGDVIFDLRAATALRGQRSEGH